MDFKNFKPVMLVAMPELLDPNFHKTVVLLSHFDQNGAFGFVANRPSEHTLGDVISLPEGELNPQFAHWNLYTGGPVEPHHVWIIFEKNQFDRPEDIRLSPDITMAKDVSVLTDTESSAQASRVRVFHGYAGWSAKQLEEEIAASAWLIAPLTLQLLFETPADKMWATAVRSLGIHPDQLVGPNSSLLN